MKGLRIDNLHFIMRMKSFIAVNEEPHNDGELLRSTFNNGIITSVGSLSRLSNQII